MQIIALAAVVAASLLPLSVAEDTKVTTRTSCKYTREVRLFGDGPDQFSMTVAAHRAASSCGDGLQCKPLNKTVIYCRNGSLMEEPEVTVAWLCAAEEAPVLGSEDSQRIRRSGMRELRRRRDVVVKLGRCHGQTDLLKQRTQKTDEERQTTRRGRPAKQRSRERQRKLTKQRKRQQKLQKELRNVSQRKLKRQKMLARKRERDRQRKLKKQPKIKRQQNKARQRKLKRLRMLRRKQERTRQRKLRRQQRLKKLEEQRLRRQQRRQKALKKVEWGGGPLP